MIELRKDTMNYPTRRVGVGLGLNVGEDADGLPQIFAARGRVNGGDTGTALTIDWALGTHQRVRLTGNCTFTFNNPRAGELYRLELVQDGTGSRTATWPGAVLWPGGTAPTLTTTGNRKDIVQFLYDGSNFLGATFGLNFNTIN